MTGLKVKPKFLNALLDELDKQNINYDFWNVEDFLVKSNAKYAEIEVENNLFPQLQAAYKKVQS